MTKIDNFDTETASCTSFTETKDIEELKREIYIKDKV